MEDGTKNMINQQCLQGENAGLIIESLSPVKECTEPLTQHSINIKSLKEMPNKARVKCREMDDLDANQILPSRLRSISGRVYSTGMVIETPATSASTIQQDTLPEEGENCDSQSLEEISTELAEINMQKPCSDGQCCKNTAKIVNLITKLQQSVDEIKVTNNRQSNFTASVSQHVREIEEKADENTNEIGELRRELKESKFQIKLISNVIIKQDQQIATLSKKLNDAQQREMFSNIVISGIPESSPENTLQKFNKFVAENLQVQELIPAHRAYRIGTGTVRPLLVELRDPLTYKPKIYAHVSKLKGQKNAQGASYFVSDHLPDEYNEQRRRMNELYSQNRKRDPSKKANMTMKRGRLLIDEEPYKKAVVPPTPRDILYPNEAQFDLADEIDMVKGKEENEGNSRFIAYAAAVKDLDDIRAAYIKVRMKFADATHIVCAYRIPGDQEHMLQDYADDGENGAGRALLGVLKDEGLMNAVIFMIRYYGGRNLGSARFDLFRKVAVSSVQALRIRLEKQKEEEAAEAAAEIKRQQQLGSGWPTPPPPSEDWSKDIKAD